MTFHGQHSSDPRGGFFFSTFSPFPPPLYSIFFFFSSSAPASRRINGVETYRSVTDENNKRAACRKRPRASGTLLESRSWSLLPRRTLTLPKTFPYAPLKVENYFEWKKNIYFYIRSKTTVHAYTRNANRQLFYSNERKWGKLRSFRRRTVVIVCPRSYLPASD